MKTTYPVAVYQIALTYLPEVGPVKGKKLASRKAWEKAYPPLVDIKSLLVGRGELKT